MEHISKTISKATTSTNSTKPVSKLLSDDKVKWLFAFLQANYGSRWADQTGKGKALQLAMRVWAEKLYGLSNEQIKYGLDNLPQDWPPTPAKFKAICTKENEAKKLGMDVQAHKAFAPALPVPDEIKEQRRATARKQMAKIRRIMKGDRQIERVAS